MRAGANYYVKLGAKVRAGANLGALRAGAKFGSKCIFVFFSKLSELSIQNMAQIPYIFLYL